MYTGPNVTNDNLVFGYDTGYGVADNATSTRFYPGEPTVNEFYGSGSSGTILDYSTGYGGLGAVQTGALDAFGTTDNIVYRKTGKLRFGPTGGQDVGTLINGNTYTFSIYLRHYGTTIMSGGEFDIVDQSSGGKNFTGTLSSNMTYEWKRFSVTSTHTNNSNYHFVDVGVYQGTGVFEWCMPQIDVGSHATPFTKTSRSNTASLIDLKRTEDISVANVSFDSTGQPEFDGTDDIIEVSRQIDTANYSAEFVFKASVNTSGTEHWLGAQYTQTTGRIIFDLYTDNTLRNFISGTSITGGTTIATGVWYHAVFTRDSSGAAKIYLNGAQDATGTISTATPLNTDFEIGGSTVLNSKEFTGNIAVVKVYNKVLSAAEVTQNYNAYKNRFNI